MFRLRVGALFAACGLVFAAGIFATASGARPVGSTRPAQVPGGIYTGPNSAGGTVTLRLSDDGSSVVSFAADGLGGICPFTALSISLDVPIQNHSFSFASSPASFGFTSISGSFPTPTTVQGSFTPKSTAGFSPCSGGKLTFTATVAAPPPPTAPTPTTPAPAPSPPRSSGPYFSGGHGGVKLARAGRTVTVNATFRGCGSRLTGLRLLVTEKHRVGTSVLAESRFTKTVPPGRSAPPAVTTPCRDFAVSWPLARKFFGSGWVIITIELVDTAGNRSGAPAYALRAPKP